MIATSSTPLAPNAALPAQVGAAAAAAGLAVLASEPGTSFDGTPTTHFTLVLAPIALDAGADAALDAALNAALNTVARTTQLELSQSFEAGNPEFAQQLATFLAESARRLHNPRPDTFLTLGGLPLSYDHFAWPFHESTAGADTSLVHGQVNLETGEPSVLHAKISAAMTVTFREVVRAPEQPFAESFILNAVRKTFDQGQLELVKSGNRQPVPVTTRYFSARQNRFVFNDTDEPQRRAFLAAKVYWLSGVLGASAPVWLLDPRDAQYLNCTVADLKVSTDALAKDGLITPAADPAYAAPAPALLAKKADYDAEVAAALHFIKPSFNEDMRGGLTNM